MPYSWAQSRTTGREKAKRRLSSARPVVLGHKGVVSGLLDLGMGFRLRIPRRHDNLALALDAPIGPICWKLEIDLCP